MNNQERKVYPPKLKKVLSLESKSMVLDVPVDEVLEVARNYQVAHQDTHNSHKLTLSEICSLIIFQGLKKTKDDIKKMKNDN